MKKKFVTILSSLILGITSLFVPIFNNAKIDAHAISADDTTSYVSVGELWDDANKVMSKDNLSTLFRYISGEPNVQYQTIKDLATQKLTAKGMRENSLTGMSGTVLKEAGKDIVVTFGGMEWQVMYLSNTKNNEPILTLWLANSSGISGSSFGGYYDGEAYLDPGSHAYPMSMYGTSNARTVSLNAGGYKATGRSTVVYVEQKSTNIFASFTMPVSGDYNDLTDFITTPSEVYWQEMQRASEVIGSEDFSNEGWSSEIPSDKFNSGHYAKENRNFANKEYNDAWKNDYIWLPSYTEIGGASIEKGIWEPSANQKKSNTSYMTRTVSTNRDWSGTAVNDIDAAGTGVGLLLVNNGRASVRPALHLNLARAFESVKQTLGGSNQTIYLDPITGNDENDGLNALTPIKSFELAEELVLENGEIVVMNTIDIVNNKILGENKAYTLKRYYANKDVRFVGNILNVGTYVSAGSADNKRVLLTLDKATIDGSSAVKGESFVYWASSNAENVKVEGTLINAVNAEVYLKENSGLQNNFVNLGSTNQGAGVRLYNESTFTVDGATIHNLCAWTDGGVVANYSTGKIVVYDGTFTKNYTQLNASCFFSDDGEIIIYNGEFLNNYSQHSAGLFDISDGTLTIYDGVFSGTVANSGTGGVATAQTVYIYGGTFTGSRINYTSSGCNGGVFSCTNAYIYGGEFSDNKVAHQNGGVILASKNVELKNATFTGNEASYGGVVSFTGTNGNLVIDNCVFEGNKATSQNSDSSITGGGVVHGSSIVGFVKNSNFINNEVFLYGGVFNTKSDESFTVINCSFSGNRANDVSAQGKGGVGTHSNVANKAVKYYNCDFVSNFARAQGGAINEATVYDSSFVSNQCGYDGGAIYGSNAYNCQFINNTTYHRGGAAAMMSEIDGCSFSNSKVTISDGQGGAVYLVKVLKNSTFTGNSALACGGALCLSGAGNWFDSGYISNCVFERNLADVGGAIAIVDDRDLSLEIVDIVVKNNVAKAKAGGIYSIVKKDILIGDAHAFADGIGGVTTMVVNNNFIGESIESFTVDANGDFVGSEQSNWYIEKGSSDFKSIILLSNLTEDSKIGFSSDEDALSVAFLTNAGVNTFITEETVKGLFIDNEENYKAYSQSTYNGSTKTGVEVKFKEIDTTQSGILYTASDNFVAHDGEEHTINVNVYSPATYTIWYAADEIGPYSTDPVAVSEAGASQKVWFYIEADGNKTNKEYREVKIDTLQLNINTDKILAKFPAGYVLQNNNDISGLVDYNIYDAYGNAVACSFIWADGNYTTSITDTPNNKKTVNIVPYNTEKYKSYNNVEIPTTIFYENAYFKNDAFYPTDEFLATEKAPVASCTLANVVKYLADNGKVYFASSYKPAANEKIVTDKTATFVRYTGFTASIITNAKNSYLGSNTMTGKIVIDGLKTDSSSALITNSSVLNISGNVVIKNNKNTSTSNGSGILNTGELVIDGLTILDCYSAASGAGIHSTAELTAKNLTIDGCYAKKEGAGAYISGGATITDSKIINNRGWKTANNTEGAVGVGLFITQNLTLVILKNTEISSNIYTHTPNSTNLGGGMFVNAASVMIQNCKIDLNDSYDGAGIYVMNQAKIIIEKTTINLNNARNSGGGIYAKGGSEISFISGSISSNNANANYGGGIYITDMKTLFNFGETGSKEATALHNWVGSNSGTFAYITSQAKMRILGGIIGEQHTSSDLFLIYVGEKGMLELLGGELLQESNGVSYFFGIYGKVSLSKNFKYPRPITFRVFKCTNEISPKFYILDDVSQMPKITVSVAEKTSIPYYNIVRADTSVYAPENLEKWIEINNVFKVTSGVSGWTISQNYIYDTINNLYTIYIDTAPTASGAIYFDPGKTKGGNDSNNGTTLTTPLATWDEVLKKSQPGQKVYLLTTWDIKANTTINGGARVLTRYYNSSSGSLVAAMINIHTSNVTLTINNLVIDGNKTKDGTVSLKENYFSTTTPIISCVGKTATINLFNNTHLRNNYVNGNSALCGAGVGIQLNTVGCTVTLNIANSKITDNNVVSNNYDGAGGAAIRVKGYDAIANTNFELNVSHSEFNNHYTYSSSNAWYRLSEAVISISNTVDQIKSYKMNISDSKFIGNICDSTATDVNGIAIGTVSYSGSKTMATYDYQIKNCEFVDNYLNKNNNSWISSVICFRISNSGTDSNFDIEDCKFTNNNCPGGEISIYQNLSKADVNIKNVKIYNENRTYKGIYVENQNGSVVNIEDIDLNNRSMNAITITGALYNDLPNTINVKNIKIDGAYAGINIEAEKVDVKVDNIQVYNCEDVAIYLNRLSSAKVTNATLSKNRVGIYVSNNNLFQTYFKNIKIDAASRKGSTFGINFDSASVHRTSTIEDVEINSCEYGISFYSNYVEKRTNLSLKNVNIYDSWYSGIRTSRVNLVGDNVNVYSAVNYGFYSGGESSVSGINVYKARYGIHIRNSSENEVSLTNCYVENAQDYGIYFENAWNENNNARPDINISNITVRNSNYGLYMNRVPGCKVTINNIDMQYNSVGMVTVSTGNWASVDYGISTINIFNSIFSNNITDGFEHNFNGYTSDTSNPTRENWIFRNCEFKNNGRNGMYLNGFNNVNNTSVLLTGNLDIDATNEFYYNTTGIYCQNNSDGTEYAIDGGSIKYNKVGVYGNTTITGGTITDNEDVDVHSTLVYLSGDFTIGTIAARGNNATTPYIYIKGNITKANSIKLLVRTTISANSVLVMADSSYSPSASVWTRIAGYFTCDSATTSVTTGKITVVTGKNTDFTVNTYYFDPSNSTGKARATNDGRSVNTPFLNWSQVAAATKDDNTKELTVYVLSKFNVTTNIDGKGIVLKYYIKPDDKNMYNRNEIMEVTATVTITNLIVDGNVDRNGAGYAADPYFSLYQEGEYIQRAIYVKSGGNLTLSTGFKMRNFMPWSYGLIDVDSAILTLDGVEFEEASIYSNHRQIHASGSSSVIIKNSTFTNFRSLIEITDTTSLTIDTCNFYDVYSELVVTNSSSTAMVKNCNVTNKMVSNHGNLFDVYATRTINVSGCNFNNIGNCVLVRDNARAVVKNCEVTNSNTNLFYLYGVSSSIEIENVEVSRVVTVVYCNKSLTNLSIKNLRTTDCQNVINYSSSDQTGKSTVTIENSVFDTQRNGLYFAYMSNISNGDSATNKSTITLKNTTIKNSKDNGFMIQTWCEFTEITLDNCNFINNKVNIYNKNPNLTLKNGTVIDGGMTGIEANFEYFGNITIENATIKNQTGAAIYYYNSNAANTNTSTITMTGGLITNNARAFYCNNNNSGRVTITITGGIIDNTNGKTGVYNTDTITADGSYSAAMFLRDTILSIGGDAVIECGIYVLPKTGTSETNVKLYSPLTEKAYVRFIIGKYNATENLIVASGYSGNFTSSSWQTTLSRIFIDGWTTAEKINGTFYGVATGVRKTDKNLSQTANANVFYFDPANTTGKAKDTNSGNFYDSALLTLDALIEKASVDSTIYVVSQWIITESVTLDFKGLTLTRYYYDDGSQLTVAFIKVEKAITVTIKNLNIDGNAKTVSNSFRAIYVNHKSAVLTVENCSFTNIYSDQKGGSIFTGLGATLTVEDCLFTNSKTTQEGGAIYATGNTSVSNCRFEGNSATSGASINIQSITSTEILIEVYDCVFERNSVTSYGAGLRCNQDGSTFKMKVVAEGCIFKDNSANYAVDFSVGALEIEISNCYSYGAKGTSANGYGAAFNFSSKGGAVKVENCEIYNADAKVTGVLSIRGMADSVVNNCKIINCSAQKGAIAIEETGNNSAVFKPTITNCYISNSFSADIGNGIYIYANNEKNGVYTIENVVLENLGAPKTVIHINTPKGQVNIKNVTLENINISSYLMNITAVSNEALNVNIEGLNVKDCASRNSVAGLTGDIFIKTTGNISIKDSYFMNNSFRSTLIALAAPSSKNATAVVENIVLENNTLKRVDSTTDRLYGLLSFDYVNATLKDSKFIGNYAATQVMSGIISVSKGTLEATNILVEGNTVSGQLFRVAGSAYIDFANFRNVTIRNNKYNNIVSGTDQKQYSGSGIYLQRVASSIVEDSVIENNITSAAGGAVMVFNGNMVMRNTIISGNQTLSSSTSIPSVAYQKTSASTTTGDNYHFYGGGGIAITGGSFEADNIEVVGNYSASFGGGLALYAPAVIRNSKIYNNSAMEAGGLIATANLVIENSVISNNKSSSDAGAIEFCAELSLINTEISDNYAFVNGIIYGEHTNAELTVENSIIKNNFIGGSGTVYFGNTSGKLNINNSTFENNISFGEGAAIYSVVNFESDNIKFVGNQIYGSSLVSVENIIKTSFNNSTISGNYANGDDATLFKFITNETQGIPMVTFTNSTIYGNTSTHQALITVENNIYIVLSNVYAYGNTNLSPTGKGGVIHVKEGSLSLENSILQNNYAYNGAAAYIGTGSELSFVDSEVNFNNSGKEGNYHATGVIYIAENGEANFMGGSVSNNDLRNSDGVIFNAGILTIEGTRIEYNIGKNGVLYNAATGRLALQDFALSNNVASNGGAIANHGLLHFVSGELSYNKATDSLGADDEIIYGCGGAVYNGETGTFTLTDGEFKFNSAGQGGAVYNNGHFVFNGGKIINNTIRHAGGGVYNDVKGRFIFNDGLISENKAEEHTVAAIGLGFTNAGLFNMLGGEISNNYVEEGSLFTSTKGGGLFATSSSLTQISGGAILDNLAESGAGAYFDTNASADIEYITIGNPSRLINSRIHGRAIYANSASIGLSNVTICSPETAVNNSVGAIYSNNAEITLKYSTFQYNKDDVGFITCVGGSLSIEDTLFNSNETNYDSDTSEAIVNVTGLTSLTIKDCDFINNSTHGDGGAIKITITNNDFTGLIENSYFSGNEANGNGGAIAVSSSSNQIADTYLTIKTSTFTQNSAANGGALYVNGGGGITIDIQDNIFGSYEDINNNEQVDSGETRGNTAAYTGGAISIELNETSPAKVMFNKENEITYNTARTGAGVYYNNAFANTPDQDVYTLLINSGSKTIIYNNTDKSGAVSNLYVTKTADLRIALSTLKVGSQIGLTLKGSDGSNEAVGDVVVKSYVQDIPLNSSDFKAFTYDNEAYRLKLDATTNSIVLAEGGDPRNMVVIANDAVYSIDGTYKNISSENFTILGATDVTITYSETENGSYSPISPKYMSKGEYTIWYQIVDNDDPSDIVTGSVKLKIVGKILVIEKAPTAYLNKGETLAEATFKYGLVTNNGSAVSGTWVFEDADEVPSNVTEKYKLKFVPYNEPIYENVATTYVNISMSFLKVYYYSSGSTVGFFNDREHNDFTGITSLSEMVSCMRDLGGIYFMSSYVVTTNETVIANNKIFMARYARFEDAPIISIPNAPTPIKFTLGGGVGEISLNAKNAYTSYLQATALFTNYGQMSINKNVTIRGFINDRGGAAVVNNYGTLYLNDCSIFDNRSRYGSKNILGGAIYNEGTMYINGGDYRLNRSDNPTSGYTTYGGFAYNKGGHIYINGGLFVRNIAANGGFIYSNGGTITLSGGDIMFNQATKKGGAIYLANGSVLNLNGGNILRNVASTEGPGVYNEDSDIYLNGGEIKFNVVVANAAIGNNVEEESSVNIYTIIIAIILTVFVCFSVYFYLPKRKKVRIFKMRK